MSTIGAGHIFINYTGDQKQYSDQVRHRLRLNGGHLLGTVAVVFVQLVGQEQHLCLRLVGLELLLDAGVVLVTRLVDQTGLSLCLILGPLRSLGFG